MVQGILQSAKDHPRVCGEQFIYAREVVGDQGSPPRVRGTGFVFTIIVPFCRITPACAGNSPPSLPAAGSIRDHPRVCGEQSALA